MSRSASELVTRLERFTARLAFAPLAVMVSGGPAVADFNQDGIDDIGLVLPLEFGAGPGQRAELVLDNRNCRQDLVATVTTVGGRGLIVHEALHVLQGGATLYPVPIPDSPAGRQQYGILIRSAPGPCVEGLEGGLSLINGNGSTAAVHRIPAHTPEWTNQAPNDPGATVLDGGINDYVHISPIRVGPGQAAEFAFWNRCAEDMTLELSLEDVQGRGELRSVSLDLPPSTFQVLEFPVPAEAPAVTLRGSGTISVAHPEAGPCPAGLSPLVGTLSIVNTADETTTVVSGLPTGKRMHKP